MGNYKEELEVILDLLEEWCRKSGANYVTASVTPGAIGSAWDRIDEGDRTDEGYRFDVLRNYGEGIDGKK